MGLSRWELLFKDEINKSFSAIFFSRGSHEEKKKERVFECTRETSGKPKYVIGRENGKCLYIADSKYMK